MQLITVDDHLIKNINKNIMRLLTDEAYEKIKEIVIQIREGKEVMPILDSLEIMPEEKLIVKDETPEITTTGVQVKK
jgi:hypothetical protein